MIRDYHYGYSYEDIKEIKLSECELSKLVLNDQEECGHSYTFFIKDEEDEYGCKLKILNNYEMACKDSRLVST